jgi:ferredoxin
MSTSHHLRVDPILCDAHGHCAELLPELISLDEWGYPILADDPIPPELQKDARRAVAMCPRLALTLERSGPSRAARAAAPRRVYRPAR